MIYNPHQYQAHANDHIIDNAACGLFLEMGLGKTVTTLTAINDLMFDRFDVAKVLVIAPKRVAEDTWTTEAGKWDHLKHLKISLVLGTDRQRKEALLKKADIWIINRENVAWLIAHYQSSFPFDMLVIDELSSFKNAKSIRFKALRTVRPKIKRVVGLTGTPAPNGLLDLWPQLYLLDQGERLGKTLTGYRQKYFSEGKRNGHIVYEYNLQQGKEQEIYDAIGDICISMKSKDYLELPERIDTVNWITFPKSTMDKYLEFERTLILSIDNVDDISPANAGGLTNKLLQFTNGAVYDDEKNWHEIHHEKIEALAEDMEAANGKPVLVLYSYQSDIERIMKAFKEYSPRKLKGPEDIRAWNRGEIPMLLGHPASIAYGLNMQEGGNLISWFGVQWGLELYQQAIARLDRQGQKAIVNNRRILVRGTIDEDVIQSLSIKTDVQDGVMNGINALNAVKARIKKYLKTTI